MDGCSSVTRLLGCAYLHPHVVPEAHCAELTLRHDDEFIVLANRGLWRFVGAAEAVEAIYEMGSPVVAAKHLLVHT